MTSADALKIVQDGIVTVLLVSAPPLLLGLIVGVIVSIFQAVTSIQEATLAFVPKIIAVFLAIFLFGNWMWTMLEQFTLNIFNNIPAIVKGIGF